MYAGYHVQVGENYFLNSDCHTMQLVWYEGHHIPVDKILSYLQSGTMHAVGDTNWPLCTTWWNLLAWEPTKATIYPYQLTRYARSGHQIPFTVKTQYRKFETNIPRKGIARPQPQFPHSCVCERFIYIFPRSVCLFCHWKIFGPIQSWEFMNRSQTHECGYCDWGRAIPFLGIYKWVFRCSVW